MSDTRGAARVKKTVLSRRAMHPAAVLSLGFVLLVLAGACVLTLPVCAKNGQATAFVSALFTATSAVCVTGLAVLDTATHWSGVGQAVILLLIQIGGLGFMAFACLGSMLMRRRITLHERMVLGAGLGVSGNAGVIRLTQRLLRGTLVFEGAGALLLSLRFVPLYGAEGLKLSIFHAVSAFCNAGFDLFGDRSTPFGSLAMWVDDPLVCGTLMALVVIGGLGFFVWNDLWENHGKLWRRGGHRRLRLHTRLVLTTTAVLLVGGFVLTLVLEWNNPATLGTLPIGARVLAAAFQSVTWRTAGFSTIDQGALCGATQAVGVLLMLTGGSPGSTAGGIKTVTMAVLLLTALRTFAGHAEVCVFGRTIPTHSIRNAVALLLVGGALSLVSAGVIATIEGMPFAACFYETVSAFSTTGLSMGITPALGVVSRLLLILLMYLGRVGILTLGVAVLSPARKPAKLRLPEEQVMVG